MNEAYSPLPPKPISNKEKIARIVESMSKHAFLYIGLGLVTLLCLPLLEWGYLFSRYLSSALGLRVYLLLLIALLIGALPGVVSILREKWAKAYLQFLADMSLVSLLCLPFAAMLWAGMLSSYQLHPSVLTLSKNSHLNAKCIIIQPVKCFDLSNTHSSVYARSVVSNGADLVVDGNSLRQGNNSANYNGNTLTIISSGITYSLKTSEAGSWKGTYDGKPIFLTEQGTIISGQFASSCTVTGDLDKGVLTALIKGKPEVYQITGTDLGGTRFVLAAGLLCAGG